MIFNWLLRKVSRIARAILIKAQLTELQYINKCSCEGKINW